MLHMLQVFIKILYSIKIICNMCNMFNMCYNSIFRDDIPCNMCVTCVVTWLLTILDTKESQANENDKDC